MYEGEAQYYSRQSYQPQPYQPPMLHPLSFQQAPVPQQLSYQPPPPLVPQMQQLQQQQQLEVQEQEQQEKGFRLFSKKRSKTQPSASQPPEFGQSLVGNQGSSFINGHASNGAYMNPGGDVYSGPLLVPDGTPSGPVISPIFMSEPPAKNKPSQESSSKSSKWRPFGKKKSKSFSNHDTSTDDLPHQDSAQVVPGSTSNPAIRPKKHLVDPGDHADAYRTQADWYVESNPDDEHDDFDNQDAYYDDEDEDVDPFYIADTKGRAQAFEGKVNGVLTNMT